MRIEGRLARFARAAGALAAAVTFGGCFQSTTLVKVNADGSGTIEQTMLFTGAALTQLRQFAALGNSGKEFDPLSEAQARQAAASIGPSVAYVSSTPIKTDTAQGRSIVYSFPDITELRISQQPPAPGGVTVRSNDVNAAGQSIRFELTHQPNGNAVLRILFPAPRMPATPDSTPDSAAGPNRASPEQIAMIKQLFAGARLAMAVEPAGTLVRTSSPWVDGPKVTLLDVQFDQLMTDEAAIGRLQGVQNVEEAKAALKNTPGLKVNLDREITIEFTPKK